MRIKINKKNIIHLKKAGDQSWHPGIVFIVIVFSIIIGANLIGSLMLGGNIVYVSIQSTGEMTGMLKSGTPAPNFILSNLTNGKISNFNFKGSPLVLIFWTTWNQLSVDQLQVIDNYIYKNPNADLKVLAINSQQDEDLVASFIKRGGYKIPVAIDTNGGVGESYGAHNLPAVYFVDRSGTIVSSYVGYLNESNFITKLKAIMQ